ncbi:hypothetical protein KC845_04145 [Candidatus Kaiserbacteria bacterium]|nr:hypothetical protein [Candidatus Kaiserbacteria bacterium]
MSEPIIINGRKLGRFRAGWLLFKESWRFLSADRAMIWIPAIAVMASVFLFGVLVSVFALVAVATDMVMVPEGEEVEGVLVYAFVFGIYLISAFTLALSQAGIAKIVYARVHGEKLALKQGIKTALAHWPSLLVWSLITSTVGLFLNIIAERSKMLGKLVSMFLGAGWALLTYFVVPAIVIDKLPATKAISRSGTVFKNTWGETLVSNFSIGIIFALAHVMAFLAIGGLVVMSVVLQIPVLVGPLILLLLVWVVVASLVQSAMNAVVKTLLYVFATENTSPEDFDSELLEHMLGRNNYLRPAINIVTDGPQNTFISG